MITNFSGTATYAGISVTVTQAGSVASGGAACLPSSSTYWVGTGSSIGSYMYTLSAPVSSIQINLFGLNGGAFGQGDSLLLYINGSQYFLSPSEIVSYTGCGSSGAGPSYLSGGILYGTIGSTTDYSGAVINVHYCGSINSFELKSYLDLYGYAYEVGIDTASVSGVSSVGAITGPTSFCLGSTITLSDTTAGGTWSSSTPSVATVSGGTVSGVAAGTDTIKYTVTTVCGPQTVYKVITVNTLSPVTGPTHLCPGSTVTLTDATPGGIWSSGSPGVASVGSSSGVVSGLATGTASISYVSACGLATTTVTVSTPPGPITGNLKLCVGSTTTLGDSGPGGTWTSNAPGVASVGSTTGIVAGNASGMATISYTLGACGTVTAMVTVVATPGPIVGPSAVCIDTTATYTDASTGDTWSSSNTAVATIGSASGILTPHATGVTNLTYGLGSVCYATKAVEVDGAPDAGVITSNAVNLFCIGFKIVLQDTAAGGVWSVRNHVATLSGDTLMAVTPGVDTVYYTVTNACGVAVVSDTFRVPPPLPEIRGALAMCVGDTAILTDSAWGGMWQGGNPHVFVGDNILDSGVVVGLSAGTAVITYQMDLGCATETVVTVEALPSVTAAVVPVSCYHEQNGSITLTAGGPATAIYTWTDGNYPNPRMGLAPGVFVVHVQDSVSGCGVTDTFRITQPDSLGVSPVVLPNYCSGNNGSISLDVSGGTAPYKYLWSMSATGNHVSDLAPGVYTVTVTDSNNCKDALKLTVADSACPEITIYDGVSPNGDGINDTWVIRNIQNFPENKVALFDKWGDEIFSATNYKNDWDGQGKKGAVPDGTYYYVVQLNTPNPPGGKGSYTGYLMLKR